MKTLFKLKQLGMLLVLVIISLSFAFIYDLDINKAACAFNGVEVAFVDGTGAGQDGLGTEEYPYLISKEGHLLYLARNYNPGSAMQHYRLEANLDFNGFEFEMISALKVNAFRGVFDGNNFTISNIEITNVSTGNSYGLFGFINGGTVKDLNIININAEFINKNSKSVGGIVGEIFAGAEIDGCSVSSSRLTGYNFVGGIAGVLDASEIKDSRVYSSYINAQINAGGIAAAATGEIVAQEHTAKITNCTGTNNNIVAEAYIIMAGINPSAAGITAVSLGTLISGCASTDNNILSQRYTAGLVGIAASSLITNSYNTSTVSGSNGANFAGLVSPAGSPGVAGIAGLAGASGKPGAAGASGGRGGSAGGLVCMLDYESGITNSFNAGLVTAGAGGSGGNGGNGGTGGNGTATSNGGNGGDGGVGGNGGAGGNAGAIFAHYANNPDAPVDIYILITSVYTRPGMVSLGASSDNGGEPGTGGAGGNKGYGQNNGDDGVDGAAGLKGDSGSIIILTGEENRPALIFDYNGGSGDAASRPVHYGAPFGGLPIAENTGHKFMGWKNSKGELVTANTLFLSLTDITITAQWQALNSVTVNLNNGTPALTLNLEDNDRVVEALVKPTRAGWAFDGWFTDAQCSTPLLAEATAQQLGGTAVYAKWLQEIRIYFNVTEGGTIVNGEQASELNNFNAALPNQLYVIRVSGRPLGSLPVARPSTLNSSYYFGGWYENLADTNTLVAATTVYQHAGLTNGQITLSSRWNTNAFLEYNLMGADGIDECSPKWDGLAEAYGGKGVAGFGTQANPYTIANAKQLRQMAIDINAAIPVNKAAHFILTNNIDLNNLLWTPIGNGVGSGANISRFEGSFHGNGFYIKNLNVTETIAGARTSGTPIYLGLFGAAYNAKITQIGLESGTVSLNTTGTGNINNYTQIYVGSVIGRCAGATLIEECYSNIGISLNVNRSSELDLSAFIGGLIGRLDNGADEGNKEGWTTTTAGSSFINSYFNGTVTSHFNYSNGRVHHFVGGIIGYVYRSNFANIFNTGNINISTIKTGATGSTIAFAGGICGEINSGGNLANCFNTGEVRGHGQATGGDRRVEVGGIVAHLNDASGLITINGCKNTGNLYLTRAGTTATRNTTANVNYEGDGLGGIIGLIVGSTGVKGINNQYTLNNLHFRDTAAGAFTQYRNVGIDYYTNGAARTRPANTDNITGGQYNGNHLISGNNNLVAHGYDKNHDAFAFTNNAGYFASGAYFVIPSTIVNASVAAPNVGRWDFQDIWEFRLDRNDNLPLLKYMSYLTEFDSGVLTPNRKYVYNGERVGRLITPVRTGFTFEGWWNMPVEFDSLLGDLAYNGIIAQNGQNGLLRYQGKNPYSLADTNSTVFQGLDNIQIYAAWMPDLSSITFTVTLTGLPANDTITGYKGYALRQLYDPQREGYDFLGWFDGGGTRYYNTTVYALSGNLILTARWQARSYGITFNANGGFVSKTAQGVLYDEVMRLLPTPHLFGHAFLGWNTAPDGSGIYVRDNEQYKIAHNVTLYAVWEINRYTVSFDANISSLTGSAVLGGTAMTEQLFTFYVAGSPAPDSVQNLKANSYEITGFIFLGWALTPNSKNVVYTDGAEYKMDTEGNKTLYAVWSAETFFVRMNVDGGTVSNPSGLIREGAAGQPIPLPNVIKAGFVLVGWFEMVGAAEQQITGSTYTITKNADIYCKWGPKPYYITFDKNDVSGSTSAGGSNPPDQSVTGAGSINLNMAASDYTRDGYTFIGWALTVGGTVAYTDGAVFYMINDLLFYVDAYDYITLYAVWKPDEFVTQFYSNAEALGRTAAVDFMENQIFKFDQSKNLSRNAFEIIGLEFLGWATTEERAVSGLIDYVNLAAVEFSNLPGSLPLVSPVKLYAVWGSKAYVLEFQSGSQAYSGNEPISALFGDDNIALIQKPAEFEREGNTFRGWSLVRNPGEFDKIYDMNVSVPDLFEIDELAASKAIGNKIILYAIWQPAPYELIIYDSDGVAILRTISVFYGVPAAYYDRNIFEKEGYDFNGLTFDGSTVVVGPSALITVLSTYFDGGDIKDLIAKYTPTAITIFELSKNAVTYSATENLTLRISARFDVLYALDPSETVNGIVSIDANGVITVKATGRPEADKVRFKVIVTHPYSPGTFAYEIFEVDIEKCLLAIATHGSQFIYTGQAQNADVDFALSNVAPGDSAAVKNASGLEFRQTGIVMPFTAAGEYQVSLVLDGAWAQYYALDESCVFTLVMQKAPLTASGNNFTKQYYQDNPDASEYETVFSGFVNGEENTLGPAIEVNYFTLRTKQSEVGRYYIYQSIETLDNYYIIYNDGYIEVVPAQMLNAAVSLKTGPAGYVEGGKLYFNIEDINFGIEGEFTLDDFDIIWEWAATPNGTWTKINGETDNQLILTEYRLGRSVAGLYFRVRLTGKGNLSNDTAAATLSTSIQQIAAAPSAPAVPENVLITLLCLAAFILAVALTMLIIGLRHKKIVSRINLQNKQLRGEQ